MTGVGYACAGQLAVPYLVLPANTQLAITAGTPVVCYSGFGQDTVNCPQSLPLNPALGFLIKPTTQTMWPVPAGASWEFRVPVVSSTTLTSAQFGARVVVADGNSNPTLVPTGSVFVFSGAATPHPAIQYPTPDTDFITRTSAISYANIYTGGLAGTVHFEVGTTTAYAVLKDSYHLDTSNVNWSLQDDWTPAVLAPDTLYHFRMWFDPDSASIAPVYGADRTFRTLGAATSLSVSGLSGGQAGGTKQTVTVTAKDASAPPQTATGYRGTVQFTSDDLNAGLPADYTFTGADNGTHTFTLGVAFMTSGTHTLTVRDKAQATVTGAQAGISVTTSVVPPTASITAQPAWRTSTAIPLAWNGTGSPANYDVRYRKAAFNAALGAPVMYKAATATKSATFAGVAGTTYCFAARSRAAGGAVSAWTDETCTTVPLDDGSTVRTGAWTAGTGAAYYKGTYLRSTALGARLTRTGVQFNRLAIVATTCPTCGKVSVYLGTTLLKTISLVSATTVNKKVIVVFTTPELPTGSVLKTGSLVIKVVTSGKKVLIDGIVVSRYAN